MPFVDPITTLPDVHTLRTSITLSASDHAFIRSLRGNPGTVQTTINLLLAELVKQLKHHGITEYNPERYESLVSSATIDLSSPISTTGRTSGPSHPGQAAGGDDGRGVAGVAQSAKGVPDAADDAEKQVARPSKQVGQTKSRPKRV